LIQIVQSIYKELFHLMLQNPHCQTARTTTVSVLINSHTLLTAYVESFKSNR